MYSPYLVYVHAANCIVSAPLQASEDDVLPDGTYVREGSYVSYDPYVMGRLEELWEEPLVFRPERFLRHGEAGELHISQARRGATNGICDPYIN